MKTQYAAVGAAGSASLPKAVAALEQAAARLADPEKERLLAARSEYRRREEEVERFVRREPLRRVHECVFGVLALESEPVDPRL